MARTPILEDRVDSKNVGRIKREIRQLQKEIADPKTPFDTMITIAKRLAELGVSLARALEEAIAAADLREVESPKPRPARNARRRWPNGMPDFPEYPDDRGEGGGWPPSGRPPYRCEALR